MTDVENLHYDSRNGLIAIASPEGKLEKLIQPYPDKSIFGENVPDWAPMNFVGACGAVSPDGERFAAYAQSSDVMILKIRGQRIRSCWLGRYLNF